MAKSRTLESVPHFRSEAAERRFWETHDSTDYVDWAQAKEAVFPNLKPSTTTISLRLAAGLLSDLKTLANKMDVPYQSLLKVLLSESIERERGDRRRGAMPNKRSQLPRRRASPSSSGRLTARRSQLNCGLRRSRRPPCR
jgi:predicted DNA binding CopG/RHH family protein